MEARYRKLGQYLAILLQRIMIVEVLHPMPFIFGYCDSHSKQ